MEGTTFAGQKCYAVFGPKNYYKLEHSSDPRAGPYDFPKQTFVTNHIGHASVFGSRGKDGAWTIYGQTFNPTDLRGGVWQWPAQGSTTGSSTSVRDGVLIWPPKSPIHVPFNGGKCTELGKRPSIGACAGRYN